MPNRSKFDMLQALRLTRGGRLKEAVAMLRMVAMPAAKPAPAAQHPRPDGGVLRPAKFTNAHGSRDYFLYVPACYDGAPLPLLVMLHGCTQSPQDFAAGTRMNALAQTHKFLVAYPAQSRLANITRCWNWYRPEDQQRDGPEPSLIAGITGQVMRDYAVRPGQVYIAGLSAGGSAAATMGACYPELYAAIGVHSGLGHGAASDLMAAAAAMKGGAAGLQPDAALLPTIVFHGDHDRTVNCINAGQVIDQAKGPAHLHASESQGQAAGGLAYTRTIHADAAGRPMLEQWMIHGGGHGWSGGDAAGSYTESRGPDASAEMLRFFLAHKH